MTVSRRPPLLATIASCVLIGVVAFYLLTEHLQHTLGALPYVILLLCPLMHVFMHRGHGGHHDGRHRGEHGPGGHGGEARDPAEAGRIPANPEGA